MERCPADETKLWEKTRERSAAEVRRMFLTDWGPAVPEEALPYLQTVATPEDLRELGDALRECMSGIEFVRILPRMRRTYGPLFRKSGLQDRPILSVA